MNSQIGEKPNLRLLILIGALYFTQGIPLGLAFEAFPILWRDAGFGLELLAFVPLAGLPWAFKFLWAPFVENHWLKNIGRRKSWIVPMQFLSVCTLLYITTIPVLPENVVLLIIVLAGTSFFSGTQDIAVDGLAAERVPTSAFANVNALQIGGIMGGMLFGGAGSLYLTSLLGYDMAIISIAVLIAACSLPILFWQETDIEPEKAVVKASILHFIKRPGSLPILVLAFSMAMCGAAIFTLTKMLLIDANWPVEDVGILSGMGNSVMVLVGCAISVGLMKRVGANSSMILGLVITLAAGAFWVQIALGTLPINSLTLIWTVTCIGGVGVGITSVGVYTVLMGFAAVENQPGTDFTVLQSTQTFGDLVTASLITGVAASLGYAVGFSVALVVGMGAILFLLMYRKSESTVSTVREGG
ncbi:MAG: MFS transporter [Parvibaculaceae bacterium]|nr:MFS transporter [Parvibaculaceae bacterium]